MNAVGTALLILGSIMIAVIGKVMVSLLSKEVEDRLGQVGYAVLRLARRRLPTDLRSSLHDDEWLPEMDALLEEHEDRPVTRLLWSLRFSVPLLLWGARRTARSIQPQTFSLRRRFAILVRAAAYFLDPHRVMHVKGSGMDASVRPLRRKEALAAARYVYRTGSAVSMAGEEAEDYLDVEYLFAHAEIRR